MLPSRPASLAFVFALVTGIPALAQTTLTSPDGRKQMITAQLAVTRNGDRVTVAVRDAGPGIPADEIEKIFRPFERGRSRAPRGERGTGLGLAIVKRIVEAHGGAIDVASRSGDGSTFTVSLPIGFEEGAATKELHDDGIERP